MLNKDTKPHKLVVIGIDPGPVNFAITKTLFVYKKPIIIETHLIKNTIQNLKELEEIKKSKAKKKIIPPIIIPPLKQQVEDFIKEVKPILKDANCLCIERFQGRGLKGSSGEQVSIMIGIIISLCKTKKIRYKLIVASQWKNYFNRIHGKDFLKDKYKVFWKNHRVTPHTLDSFLISLYMKDPELFNIFKYPINRYLRHLTIKKAQNEKSKTSGNRK